MGFKDDFIEALRSVKRDFFRENEYTGKEGQEWAGQQTALPDYLAVPPADTPQSHQQQVSPPEPPASSEYIDLEDSGLSNVSMRGSPAFDTYYSADKMNRRGDPEGERPGNPSYHYDVCGKGAAEGESGVYSGHRDGRSIIDFGDDGIYDDDKTVISKNTIIRGALQTEDSVRLLGQIMGDIDCKSNIVLAGKVRGNTSAANAYIFDAQVDGDVRCDDVITISNDAWVLGNIRAQQAEIDGKIKGNMEIRHMVSIGSSSSILGDISTDELEIKRGAFINGQIMMYSPSRDVLDHFDRFDE